MTNEQLEQLYEALNKKLTAEIAFELEVKRQVALLQETNRILQNNLSRLEEFAA